jgi:hypothetical protein
LTVVPNDNLVSNIGFGGREATHGGGDAWNLYANVGTCEIGEIVHPRWVLPDKAADAFSFEVIRKTDPRLKRDVRGWLETAVKALAKGCMPRSWQRKVRELIAGRSV